MHIETEVTSRGLKILTDCDLVSKLKTEVGIERKALRNILYFLREVESRRLYATYGYSSLHEFTIKELKYSEGSAHRRISAMRLLCEIPEIEEKIITGNLNLSHLASAQSLFRAESKKENTYSVERKLELLNVLENKSTRDTERELAKISPEFLKQERVRQIAEHKIELKIVISEDLFKKIEKSKALRSHSHPNLDIQHLLEILIDRDLEKLDRSAQRLPPAAEVKMKSLTRYIPKQLKDAIFKRDQGKCTYVSQLTGRICESKKFLEIDHIIPWSRGGETSLDNLRLLCHAHNQSEAERILGKYVSQK